MLDSGSIKVSQSNEYVGRGVSYTSVATIHSIPLKAGFGACNPPSQIDTSRGSNRVQPYEWPGGAVTSTAYRRSLFRMSSPWSSRMCMNSVFSKTAGAGVEGVYARHGEEWVRCWRKTPSPQPTSRT